MTISHALFQHAQQHIPGGVNSPVRCFYGVGGEPIFMKSGKGPYLQSEDDKSYIDYICSWGPLILGHANPAVISRVNSAVQKGLGFGTTTKVEIELADKVCELMPNIELVRMVSSGTEATMSAIRLARGFTKRDKLLKFEGCYHGHSDSLLVKAGSGALTLGVPSSPGVPADLVQHTLTATFNDLDSAQQVFENHPDEIACVILEPIAGNMNCVPAKKAFLQGLRDLCDKYGAVLIFDEVMTGFRITQGGAQQYYDIKPDLTCLGKVIGGGLPVGAFGGKRDIMEYIAPLGPVYQAGTLSGNPVSMTAGLATLEGTQAAGFYDKLGDHTQQLSNGLQAIADKHHIPFTTNQVHSMFGFFFTDIEKIESFADVMTCDAERFKKFYHGMLERGVYLAPSMFETGFTSSAHDDETLAQTLQAADDVMKELK
tara:strand:- start:53941 stop:55224 length:1284 start_codon:yes stop_codon:yes gene_type:complete